MKMNLCTIRLAATIPTQSYGNVTLDISAEFMDVGEGRIEDVVSNGFTIVKNQLIQQVEALDPENVGVKTWLKAVQPY